MRRKVAIANFVRRAHRQVLTELATAVNHGHRFDPVPLSPSSVPFNDLPIVLNGFGSGFRDAPGILESG